MMMMMMLDKFTADPLSQARMREALRNIFVHDDDDIPDVLAFLGEHQKAKQMLMDTITRAASERGHFVRQLSSFSEVADLPGTYLPYISLCIVGTYKELF